MRAGLLRHRITLQEPTVIQTDSGEPVTAWLTLDEVWASREDLSGTEGFTADQHLASVLTRFRIRWRRDVHARLRILAEGAQFNITSVTDPDGRKAELHLLASREG